MAPDLAPYLDDLIGKPWERRGVHCWALVQQVQRDLFGREVPLGPLAVPAREVRRELFSLNAETVGWREVPMPEHGAVARMYRNGGAPEDLEHAGVYLAIDGGRVLHTDLPHGVVLDNMIELKVRGWVPRWFVPKEA